MPSMGLEFSVQQCGATGGITKDSNAGGYVGFSGPVLGSENGMPSGCHMDGRW